MRCHPCLLRLSVRQWRPSSVRPSSHDSSRWHCRSFFSKAAAHLDKVVRQRLEFAGATPRLVFLESVSLRRLEKWQAYVIDVMENVPACATRHCKKNVLEPGNVELVRDESIEKFSRLNFMHLKRAVFGLKLRFAILPDRPLSGRDHVGHIVFDDGDVGMRLALPFLAFFAGRPATKPGQVRAGRTK